MRDPGQKAYENWSRHYAAARVLYDRENVQLIRMARPWFPPFSIIYNSLAGKWYLQRDRCCIAAWQLKSRSPYRQVYAAAVAVPSQCRSRNPSPAGGYR